MSRYQSSSGGSRSSGNHECKVYVGGLGSHFDRRDIEDSFSLFGKLRNVWVARNPPGFAFVEYEDARDAQDCVKGHKKKIGGREITVEMSNGERRERRYGGGGGGGGGGGSGRPPLRRASRNDKCYSCGDYGHFARDCPGGRGGGGGGGGGGRRYGGGGGYSRSRRSQSRSRSRSYSPRRRDSRSKSRSRSRSHHRHSSSSDKE